MKQFQPNCIDTKYPFLKLAILFSLLNYDIIIALLRCVHWTVSHVSYVNHGPFVLNVSFMLRKILIVRYFMLIYITTVKLVYFMSPISSCYIVQDLQLSSNGQETIRQKERGWYTLVWYHGKLIWGCLYW